MIKSMSHTCFYVLDQESAKRFYTEKPGLRDRARDVVFLQEPAERPYGTEAVFRDDSGNWSSLNQRAQP